MKKVFVATLVLIMVLCVGCGSSTNLEGRWVASNGVDTIDFLEDGVCIVNDSEGEYKVLEDGRVEINIETKDFTTHTLTDYKIEKGCLVLNDVKTKSGKAFYFKESLADNVVNEEYLIQYGEADFTGEKQYKELGYINDNDCVMNKEFASEEERAAVVEKLVDNYSSSHSLIKKEVLPCYNRLPFGGFSVSFGDLVQIDDKIYYEALLVDKGNIGLVYKFAVNSESNEIWVLDKEKGSCRLWNGTLGVDYLSKGK